MARFTLVVRPDGRALLTTEQQLSRHEADQLVEQIREWDAGHWPVAILPETTVVQVSELDLALEPAGAGRA